LRRHPDRLQSTGRAPCARFPGSRIKGDICALAQLPNSTLAILSAFAPARIILPFTQNVDSYCLTDSMGPDRAMAACRQVHFKSFHRFGRLEGRCVRAAQATVFAGKPKARGSAGSTVFVCWRDPFDNLHVSETLVRLVAGAGASRMVGSIPGACHLSSRWGRRHKLIIEDDETSRAADPFVTAGCWRNAG
jgi:hypothetical protein